MNTPQKKRPINESIQLSSDATIIALENLSDWIATDLDRLESEFDSFKTFNSIRNSIGRNAKS